MCRISYILVATTECQSEISKFLCCGTIYKDNFSRLKTIKFNEFCEFIKFKYFLLLF
jgi:hypothetical protein